MESRGRFTHTAREPHVCARALAHTNTHTPHEAIDGDADAGKHTYVRVHTMIGVHARTHARTHTRTHTALKGSMERQRLAIMM